MRIAILDLGTNTFHLLIADINDCIPEVIFKKTIAVKLGEGGINKKAIAPLAFERGIIALKEFHQFIKQYNPDKIKAVATEAMRQATNGDDFIKQVKEITDIKIELISGEEEATLIYTGVKAAINEISNSLIIDIGGGSTEFIFCDHEGIQWKKSYPLGAAKLMELFHHSDPIIEKDIHSINLHLNKSLSDLREAIDKYKPEVLIGSGGAFETFAELDRKKLFSRKLSSQIIQYDFKFDDYQLVSNSLLHSSHHERKNNKFIPPVRVDMIITAAIITNYILQFTAIKKIKYSAYSLKEGILYSEVNLLKAAL